MPETESKSHFLSSSLLVRVVAILIFAIGGMLAVGGGYLLMLGGSFYYFVAGFGLLAAGWFLLQGRHLGALIYLAVFLFTAIWAFIEADGLVWALIPRLVVPGVIMASVIMLVPLLDRRLFGWITATAATVAFAAIGMATLFMYGGAERTESDLASLPGSGLAASDPSPFKVGDDWPAYGGSYASRRYSPLAQITADNVGNLERVWLYNTGDMPEGDPAQSSYGAETTPLKVGDSIYLCTATNILIAIDPATGGEKWRHDPGVEDSFIPYTAACRGVAYFEDAGAGEGNGSPLKLTPTTPACTARIIEGTLDGRLIAVDARTGKPCADFGENGEADITVGMGPVAPGMVAMTSAPTIISGVIVTGHQVKDGISIDAPSGVLQGFDAKTGEHLWAWDMNRPDLSVRPGIGEFSRGTPNMWTTASGDEELGLVYMPMGNSAGDYLSSHRSEAEDTYSTALVALNVRTGKPAWHFRTVAIDVWDYDLGSQASLVDFPSPDGSGTIPALVLPTKQGDIYVLDRRTGEPLTDVEMRKVPGGGVEPGERAATQPFSLFATLAKPPLQERDMWGMSPIDQMICRIQFRQASYDGMYTPPTADRHWIQYPGYNGGSDWGGIAVDSGRGIIVANYNDMPNYNRLVPRAEAQQRLLKEKAGGHSALAPQAGAPYAIDVNAGWRMPNTKLLCKEPPYGGIRAIDLATGKTLWDRPFGTARNNGPFGLPSYLPFEVGTPNNGGPIVTQGGLIFIGATTDDLLKAIDLRTGETVWQDILPAGGQATPITYSHKGRQYVLMMAGGHHFMETKIGDSLVAYALPEIH